jgi:hypothetical protein
LCMSASVRSTGGTIEDITAGNMTATPPCRWWCSNNYLRKASCLSLMHAVCPVPKKLAVLDLHRNVFWGNFPGDIIENENLKYFVVHGRDVVGTISDRVSFLKNLKHLDLSFNGITGTIPNTLTQLTELRYPLGNVRQ